jgi:signal transduction histidine kinase
MRFYTTVHILLLAYIIAALLFWGFSLEKQSLHIFQQGKQILNKQVDSTLHPLEYASQLQELETKKEARAKQYLGEGITFFIVILIGAFVVYASYRRGNRLSQQQNNFMLSVTHELKSPIAAMKLNLQTLEKHQLDTEKRNQLLERCITEANRLNDLCNKILFTSQMEGRQYVASKEQIDFSKLVTRVVNEYKGRYPERFAATIQPDCMIAGDKLLLQMAVNNLLENALKYTPAATLVTVHLSGNENQIIFQVADEGDGIAEEEKKKIFTKFYRSGNESTRTAKGTGLGLYLTSKIVHQHKGTITVKDKHPHGAVFEIVLRGV